MLTSNNNKTFTKITKVVTPFWYNPVNPKIENITSTEFYALLKLPIFTRVGNSWVTRKINI